MNIFNYKHKIVILTGASSGIGKSIAEILINEYDAEVLAIARDEEKLLRVKNSFNEKKDLYRVFAFDVSVNDEWINFANYLTSENLKPSVLINCAGVLPKFSSVLKSDVCVFENALKTNYLSMVYSVKAILPLIGKNDDKGVIINVSSSSALCPFAGVAAYSASKAAAERFSECLQAEIKNASVTVALPGFTRTDVMRNQTATRKESNLISKFSAKPETVAKIILNKAKNRKKRVITGVDAHFMNFIFKFFPRSAPKLIGWFLKKTKMSIFDEVF